MNTFDRIYLDYNSTSPLSKSFIKALGNGDVLFSNASSQHTRGKESRKQINKITAKIYKTFGFTVKDYQFYFHSGATEAMNTFFQAGALAKEKMAMICFNSDHPCILEQAQRAKSQGSKVLFLDIDNSGKIDVDALIGHITELEKTCSVRLNLTYIHNETGIIQDLSIVDKIKDKTKNCFIHIDAVQAFGKTDTLKLNSRADAYSFSAHKFGGLKGIGFSFFKADFTPLIIGGGQQNGLRSGTENIQGIESISYALDDYISGFDPIKLLEFKESIIKILNSCNDIKVIDSQAVNTVCFVHNKIAADIQLVHADLLGLDISSGSACSSGSNTGSATLESMGFKDLAKNSIRISFHNDSLEEGKAILERITAFVKKIS